MSLPIEILMTRLNNEIATCKRSLKVDLTLSDQELNKFPLDIDITLYDVPGPVIENERIAYRYEHSFTLIIDRNYPFEKPLVIWRTPIFHPNIMMPEDGGHLCTRLLSEWSFNSTLFTFLKGVESLLLAPNGTSPFGTDTCTRAARYFNLQNRRSVPIVQPTQPKVVRR